jgi:heme oxygenase (mycobilin-producing)
MSIKVLISRKILPEVEPVAKPFLAELHALAWRCKGYISGEALVNLEHPEDQIVISSWQSLEEWQNYQNLEETRQLRLKIDQILGHLSTYTVYRNK